MTPERMAALVTRWVRLYTRRVPDPTAQRRVDEIEADVHDHICHERARGTQDRRLALSILSRMLRGLAADVSWRGHRSRAITGSLTTPEDTMTNDRTGYRTALGVAVAAGLTLFWMIGAVGVIGAEGDTADLMYLGVPVVGILGAGIARLRPGGMARALVATAAAQGTVAVVALVTGEHRSPVTSVFEIVGLNGFFVALFLGSAWLFRRAAGQPPPGAGSRA